MTVRDIYTRYSIMPQLQQHMLRVTGVAQAVMAGWTGSALDQSLIINTCLLHDMGNLAKFNLNQDLPGTPPLSPEERTAWKNTQLNFFQRYGTDANAATERICRELGTLQVIPVLQEENRLFFSHPTFKMFANAEPAAVLLMYADLRVMPQGISTFSDRIHDLEHRYHKPLHELQWTQDFERYIAAHTATDVASITEASVSHTMHQFLELSIPTGR